MNAFSALYTPARCVITHDDRDRPVFRLRLQVHVADVADAGTDDALEVRLQSPAWLVPAVTNWRPAGNSTWVDSTANDFERNSNLTYDLIDRNSVVSGKSVSVSVDLGGRRILKKKKKK